MASYSITQKKIAILHTTFREIFKKKKIKKDPLHKEITSLESGSFCFTTVNTDQTSLDMFNKRVSGQPAFKIR